MIAQHSGTYNPRTGRYDVTVNGILVGTADSHLGCEQVALQYAEDEDARFCDPDARTAAEIADMQQQAAYAAEPIDGEADYYALRQALSDILRCARGMEGVQS